MGSPPPTRFHLVGRLTNKEWQESPVSTTITTHPITELEFPAVTVCPPRGSNTALNHLLDRVKNINFTAVEKNELQGIMKEVFLEIPAKEYAKKITEFLNTDNMRSIANKRGSMPSIDKGGMITMRSSELEGSFSSPGFLDSGDTAHFFESPQTLHYMLDLPHYSIRNMIGKGSLVISMKTEGNWSFTSPDNKWKRYKEDLTWDEAEDFCVSHGGHLPSIHSSREQAQLKQFANGTFLWLGARRKSKDDVWQWSDGTLWVGYRPWTFAIKNQSGNDCMWSMNSAWGNHFCEAKARAPTTCASPPVIMSGSHDLVFKKESLFDPRFYFWWNETQERGVNNAPGFRIEWKINTTSKRHKTFVSKDLAGSVSTPGLHSQATIENIKQKQEFTAIIELPNNISDIIGDGAFIVDVDVVPNDEKDVYIKLLQTEFWPFPYDKPRTWEQAEEYCTSRGGVLASVDGTLNKYKLQSYMSLVFAAQWKNIALWVARPWFEDICPFFLNDKLFEPNCNNNEVPYICNTSPAETSINSSTQLVFTSKNISNFMSGIIVRWSAYGDNSILNLTRRTRGGFTLSWRLQNSTNERANDAKNTSDKWKTKEEVVSSDGFINEKEMNMMTIIHLVRWSKYLKIDKREVWKTLLKYRWDLEFVKTNPCLDEDQIATVIFKTALEMKFLYSWSLWFPEEDLTFGTELLSALHYCPGHLVEAAKLSKLFESLIANHSLTTVVAATMHNIQPRAGNTIKDFTAVNMWYQRLDKKYNFSLDSVILSLMTSDERTQLKTLMPPYVKTRISDETYHAPLVGPSLHSPHLTMSRSSALIPFCAYKTDLNFSKNSLELPGISFPLCSSFLPTILEGQLCYKVAVNETSGQGKKNELMLLLDYNDDLSIQTFPNKAVGARGSMKNLNFGKSVEIMQVVGAKVHINTLAPYTGFGGGIYKMTGVKKMSATKDFLKLPLKNRKCEAESYDDCRTRGLLEECACVPWEVPGLHVRMFRFFVHKFVLAPPPLRGDLIVIPNHSLPCCNVNNH